MKPYIYMALPKVVARSQPPSGIARRIWRRMARSRSLKGASHAAFGLEIDKTTRDNMREAVGVDDR